MLGLDGSMSVGIVISEQDASRSSGIVAHKWKWRFKSVRKCRALPSGI